jgi:hypothetical protein
MAPEVMTYAFMEVSPASRLLDKHLLQSSQDGGDCVWRQSAEPFHEPVGVNRPKSIQRDIPTATLKMARNAPGIRLARGRQGCDDGGAKMLVEFVR